MCVGVCGWVCCECVCGRVCVDGCVVCVGAGEELVQYFPTYST